MDQFIIKALLIVAFVVFGTLLLRSGGSARTRAIRTLTMLVFLAAAIVTVLFPAIINDLARSVGVGRGADLLLYGFLVAFIGHMLSNARKQSAQDRQITELARSIALQTPLRSQNHESQEG
ncbi:DUF2304 domain-containing protein [Leucobacter luti]|uniref:DUF2304 domain-containing protein n=1 Tax=Leucobacter luti TaxID=340320 RepID=UPI003CFD2FC2